jgi:hypothetical protein
MIMQALLLAPYLAIASSLVLSATVVAICSASPPAVAQRASLQKKGCHAGGR